MHECASVCACIGSRVCVCVCARTRHRFPRDVTAGLASPSVMLRWRRASSVAAAVRVRALSRCARHTHSSPLFFPKFGYGKRQHFFPPYLVMWRRASVQEQLSDAVQTSRFFSSSSSSFFFFPVWDWLLWSFDGPSLMHSRFVGAGLVTQNAHVFDQMISFSMIDQRVS